MDSWWLDHQYDELSHTVSCVTCGSQWKLRETVFIKGGWLTLGDGLTRWYCGECFRAASDVMEIGGV